jgi:hypothetical protein
MELTENENKKIGAQIFQTNIYHEIWGSYDRHPSENLTIKQRNLNSILRIPWSHGAKSSTWKSIAATVYPMGMNKLHLYIIFRLLRTPVNVRSRWRWWLCTTISQIAFLHIMDDHSCFAGRRRAMAKRLLFELCCPARFEVNIYRLRSGIYLIWGDWEKVYTAWSAVMV